MWFQNYQPTFRFDASNVLQFAVSSVTDGNSYGANRLIYANSPDGGNTWKKANGSDIPGLPIRGSDGQPNEGDVVASITTTSSNYFDPNVGVTRDKNGTIGVSSNQVWRTWQNNAWVTNSPQNFTSVPGSRNAYFMPGGDLVLPTYNISKALLTQSLYDLSYGYDYTFDQFVLDEYGIRTTGNIYAVGVTNATNVLTVVETDFPYAGLPSGWTAKEIAATLPSYRGTCGYDISTGNFSCTNYDSDLQNYSDSFYYIYKPLIGDATITAQVYTSLASVDGYSRAGVMMRETLDPGAKSVEVILAPGNNSAGSQFNYRSTPNAYYTMTSILAKNTPQTFWVKLVRAGNNFTGYVAYNGFDWIPISATTNVPMDSSIYIGLASSSIANGWFMQSTTFSNVSITTAPAPVFSYPNRKNHLCISKTLLP